MIFTHGKAARELYMTLLSTRKISDPISQADSQLAFIIKSCGSRSDQDDGSSFSIASRRALYPKITIVVPAEPGEPSRDWFDGVSRRLS